MRGKVSPLYRDRARAALFNGETAPLITTTFMSSSSARNNDGGKGYANSLVTSKAQKSANNGKSGSAWMK